MNNLNSYKCLVTWQTSGYAYVKASSKEEAKELFSYLEFTDLFEIISEGHAPDLTTIELTKGKENG